MLESYEAMLVDAEADHHTMDRMPSSPGSVPLLATPKWNTLWYERKTWLDRALAADQDQKLDDSRRWLINWMVACDVDKVFHEKKEGQQNITEI